MALFESMDSNKALIPGFTDCYVASNGTVWKGSVQKIPRVRKKAAPNIRLSLNKVNIEYGLATLVARAFVPNPEGYTKVICLDGNKQNCAATNLRWVSGKEFSRYSMHKGLPMELPPKPAKAKERRKKKERAKEKEAAPVRVPNDGRQPIPGTANYWITPQGEVFNPKGFPLKHIRAPNRGAWVKLKDKNGERVKTTVAKLVALTFIPNPCWHERVIFRDRDKTNAAAENLMWVSEWEYRSWYHNTASDLLGEARRPKPAAAKIEKHPFSMPVHDFPGYYIAPDGTVYKGDRIICHRVRKGKSLQVALRLAGVAPATFQVFGLAKLVARHFVPNPNKHRYIVFKDRNKLNCHRDNIAWVDGETFMWYSGLLQNPGRKKKIVLTREEALQRCTHTLLRNYYQSGDESWLMDAWHEVDTEMGKKRGWPEYKSEGYLYFTDRARRYSILKNPVGLMKWYLKILFITRHKQMSATMPLRMVIQTDESLRNVGEYE